jgi:tetratricopeptide (TPR) repeat protein
MGQWRHSLMTDKMTATIQIAQRVYSLSLEQKDAALMIGAYRALAATLYFSGDFEPARQHAMRGVEIWRSGGVQSPVEEVGASSVVCLCYEALAEWHFGEIVSCQAAITEAISLARELNDMNALALALHFAAYLAHYERNPTEAERLASELIELSTRHNFSYWLAIGAIFCGWARSASGDTAEGLPWIERGIRDFRANGSTLAVPFLASTKGRSFARCESYPRSS